MREIILARTNLTYHPDFLSSDEALVLFEALLKSSGWEQREIQLFGKKYLSPRLEKFCAFDLAVNYSYSSKKLKTEPFDQCMNLLISKLKNKGFQFNSALINLYRDGNDSNCWHRDNEKELGEDPVIYSVSLGAARRFHIKSIEGDEKETFLLENGSLLIMEQGSQKFYKHQLPKMTKLAEPRINITFRQIF